MEIYELKYFMKIGDATYHPKDKIIIIQETEDMIIFTSIRYSQIRQKVSKYFLNKYLKEEICQIK